LEVLSRRTKNNPVLIGKAGVGKTAIAEGIAQRIVNNRVPESLKGQKVVSLDLGLLVAGAKFQGEFEERLKAVVKDIEMAEGRIIVFIDELHMLFGLGKTQGSMDASNLLKPALARGTLKCCGATTIDEYRKYIEKDPALARRFQPVMVEEPTIQETISILRGLKEKYEIHHGVSIADSALVTAAELSDRYITDRQLPDKSIDLIDQSCAMLKLNQESKPEHLEALDRSILTLKIELESLKKEKAASEKRKDIQDQLEKLENEYRAGEKAWLDEREALLKVRRLKKDLDTARTEYESAQRAGDLAKASRLLYETIPNLERQIPTEAEDENGMLHEMVVSNDIAIVISRMTGIPITSLLRKEKEKLLNIENVLKKEVVGQDEAMTAVADAVRLGRTGLQSPSKPIASLLFLGPTGVGKTQLSKSLAKYLFDNEDSIIRLDGSEFMEKHSVSKLIGSPPGYVGYDEGGALTEAVLRKPFSIILFDEIEKAHPEVTNILLQVLDNGRLTDSHGKTVNFRNTIVIMTSNLGSDAFLEEPSEGSVTPVIKSKVLDAVKRHFSPEFINRIDDMIVFNQLTEEALHDIVKIRIAEVEDRLKEQELKFRTDSSAIKWLAKHGYDVAYGARPLNRLIHKKVLNPLAKHLVDDKVQKGDTVMVKVVDNDLQISKE
jgi:ATP-dependent Clp protease ATP-binding subunit ClpB